MGCKVIEVPSTRNIGLQTPRLLLFCMIIQVAWRTREAQLERHHFSNLSATYYFLHFLEVRQIAPVISHKARNARLPTHTVYSDAVIVCSGQRLLHINRLARTHCHNRISSVRSRRSSYIYRVHVRIIDNLLRVRVPFLYPVPLSIRARFFLASAHHRLDMRARDFIKSRSGLLLRDFSTPYKAPTNLFHNMQR